MISLPPSPSHPVLTALSSGREENILMKPLLSSYRFDPRVVSNLHVGQLEDGAVGFFSVLFFFFFFFDWKLQPALPWINNRNDKSTRVKENRTNKGGNKGNCINSNETIRMGAELIILFSVLREDLVVVLITIFISIFVSNMIFLILWTVL